MWKVKIFVIEVNRVIFVHFSRFCSKKNDSYPGIKMAYYDFVYRKIWIASRNKYFMQSMVLDFIIQYMFRKKLNMTEVSTHNWCYKNRKLIFKT